MARKNIDNAQTAVHRTGGDAVESLSKNDTPPRMTSPAHTSKTSTQEKTKNLSVSSGISRSATSNVKSTDKASNQSRTARKVRILPQVNSIAALKGDHRTAFSPSSTPAKTAARSTPRFRATPARSAKNAPLYRNVRVIESDTSDGGESEADQEEEESIFSDEDSGSDSEYASCDSDVPVDTPIWWPGEMVQALSPAKPGTSLKQKGGFPMFGFAEPLDKSTAKTQTSTPALSDSDKENGGTPVQVRTRSLALTESDTPPPPSPSKATRLASPSKQRARIPTPPGRPSLDNFWDAHEVNGWNDQHSPEKPLLSPSKHRVLFPVAFNSPTKKVELKHTLAAFADSDDGVDRAGQEPRPPQTPSRRRRRVPPSPTRAAVAPTEPSSPSKPAPSPRKSRAEMAERKKFEAGREDMARLFLAELDERITGGRVGAATSSTGGVRIVWSKTLNSTAGRASWKRERVRGAGAVTASATATVTVADDGTASSSSTSPGIGPPTQQRPSPPTSAEEGAAAAAAQEEAAEPEEAKTDPPISYRHRATIELATKVLTDPDRLRNTLAHEFCHLATYVVSGVTDRPHGPEFKAWGKRCSDAFADRGIRVTTKHGYEIEWRYLWICAGRRTTATTTATTTTSNGDTTSSSTTNTTATANNPRTPGEQGQGAGGPQLSSADQHHQHGLLVYEGAGGCGREYGRHSKSVDPDKVRCGGCKGRLIQVRPAPRGPGQVGGFAGFVKGAFGTVKKEMEEEQQQKDGEKVVHGEVMAELGRRYRAQKQQQQQNGPRAAEDKTGDGEMDALVKRIEEVVVISDDE